MVARSILERSSTHSKTMLESRGTPTSPSSGSIPVMYGGSVSGVEPPISSCMVLFISVQPSPDQDLYEPGQTLSAAQFSSALRAAHTVPAELSATLRAPLSTEPLTQ